MIKHYEIIPPWVDKEMARLAAAIDDGTITDVNEAEELIDLLLGKILAAN